MGFTVGLDPLDMPGGSQDFAQHKPDKEEPTEPPSYKNKIPIGIDVKTGEVVWMSIGNADRIGIFGRCVHPETFVRTSEGTAPIQELVKEHAGKVEEQDDVGEWLSVEKDLKVPSINEKGEISWNVVSQFYRQEIESKLAEIKIENGSELKTSLTHPVMTAEGWKQAENISEGDYIAVPKSYPEIAEEFVDEEVVYLLAFQIAEAHEENSRLSIDKKDVEALKKWKEKYCRLVEPNTSPEIKKNKGRSTHRLRICEKHGLKEYKKLLEEELGYEWGNRAADKKIPQKIVKADKAAKRVFLKTYLDTDGSISQSKKEIEYSSASRRLVESLREMLKEFGISPSLSTTSIDNKTYWRLRFSSAQVTTYSKKIGFENKSTALDKQHNPNYDGVPVCGIVAELKEENIPVGEIRSYDSGKKPSKEKIEALIEQLEKVKHYHRTDDINVGWNSQPEIRKAVYEDLDVEWINKKIEELQSMMRKEVWWKKVEEKRELQYTGYVYDMVVPGTHNYVANDIVTHNTGSGKTTLSKAILSRFYLGGGNVFVATDIKNDYHDIDRKGGVSKKLIDQTAGLYEDEKKGVKEEPQSIPVNMFAPKFLADDYRGSRPSYISPFAFSPDEINQSEFMSLVNPSSSSQETMIENIHNEISNLTFDKIKDYTDGADSSQLGNAVWNGVKSLKNNDVLKNDKRYNKDILEPLEDDEVVALSLKHWSNYRRSSMENVELQIAIALRKMVDKLEDYLIDTPLMVYVEEAHAFIPEGEDSISKEEFENIVNLGRAFGIPMMFATQYPDQIPKKGFLEQMSHYFISKNMPPDGRKKVLKIADIYRMNDAQREKWPEIFSQMDNYQWMYIDRSRSEWRIIEPFAPLVAHTG